MSIFDVQHQPRAHRILQRALAAGRLPHAYLFAGPEGVGREMMATRLAQLMLCENPVRRPLPAEIAEAVPEGKGQDGCGECEDCRMMQAGTHPDFFLVHRYLNALHPDSAVRKQKALSLSVDVIREFLINRAGTCPNRGRAKVFVIREAERMNETAQNALLKTLEEPPGSVFLILLTGALDRMLSTIRSRCQQVVFQALPTDYVGRRVSELRPEAAAADIAYVSRHANGSLGQALRQLDDGLPAMKRMWGTRLLELVGGGGAPHALAAPLENDAKTLARLIAQRDPDVSDSDAVRSGIQVLLSVLADFYADALRRQSGADLPAVNADEPAIIDALAEQYSTRHLTEALRRINEAETHLSRNANVALTLETLFIRLAHGRAGAAAVA